MRIWADLSTSVARNRKSSSQSLSQGDSILVSARTIIIGLTENLTIDGSPFAFPDDFDSLYGHEVKVVNGSLFSLTLTNPADNYTQPLVIPSGETAQFSFAPGIGWWYNHQSSLNSSNGGNTTSASSEISQQLICTQNIPAHSLVNIYELAGQVVCRLADNSDGINKSVKGFTKEQAFTNGQLATIFLNGIMSFPNEVFIPNTFYYLGSNGQIIARDGINTNQSNFLIQSIGRPYTKNDLIFEPDIIAVVKPTS